jgi:hypothetical protein
MDITATLLIEELDAHGHVRRVHADQHAAAGRKAHHRGAGPSLLRRRLLRRQLREGQVAEAVDRAMWRPEYLDYAAD